jgi:hypothetical protein
MRWSGLLAGVDRLRCRAGALGKGFRPFCFQISTALSPAFSGVFRRNPQSSRCGAFFRYSRLRGLICFIAAAPGRSGAAANMESARMFYYIVAGLYLAMAVAYFLQAIGG